MSKESSKYLTVERGKTMKNKYFNDYPMNTSVEMESLLPARLLETLEEFDRVISPTPFVSTKANFPKINIKRKEDVYTVEVGLAGYKREEITAVIEGRNLIISHKKSDDVKEEEYFIKEMTKGSFKRIINIPNFINLENIESEFQNGVLKITMYVAEASKPKILKF